MLPGSAVPTGMSSYLSTVDRESHNVDVNVTIRYMGALSNSGRKAANFVGFYKGLQSAGAAVMWAYDSTNPPFMTEFASNWALLLGSLVFAAPVIFLRIKDHVTTEEDIVFSDETLADVLPRGHAEKGLGDEA